MLRLEINSIQKTCCNIREIIIPQNKGKRYTLMKYHLCFCKIKKYKCVLCKKEIKTTNEILDPALYLHFLESPRCIDNKKILNMLKSIKMTEDLCDEIFTGDDKIKYHKIKFLSLFNSELTDDERTSYVEEIELYYKYDHDFIRFTFAEIYIVVVMGYKFLGKDDFGCENCKWRYKDNLLNNDFIFTGELEDESMENDIKHFTSTNVLLSSISFHLREKSNCSARRITTRDLGIFKYIMLISQRELFPPIVSSDLLNFKYPFLKTAAPARLFNGKVKLCSICFIRPINYISFPCMHVSFCSVCMSLSSVKRCPGCNTTIHKTAMDDMYVRNFNNLNGIEHFRKLGIRLKREFINRKNILII